MDCLKIRAVNRLVSVRFSKSDSTTGNTHYLIPVGVTTGANDPFGATATSSKTSPTVVAIP